MFRQQLLTVWANYWLHHMIRVAAEVGLGVAMFSGAVTTVVTVAPIHHKPPSHKPAPVVVAPKPVTKPVAKKPAAPASTPAPAPVTTPAPAPVTTPTPKPVASTQPSPGTGVKKLVATPPPSSPPSQPSDPSNTTTSSSDSSGSTTGTTSTASQTSAPAAATGGYYSTNWSGYAALTGKFTTVSGSWTVPTVTGNSTDTTGDAAWIGIGGVNSTDLIQTGTLDNVDPDGTVTYAIFYELLPDPAMEVVGFNVQAGDVISASITQLSSGKWTISISDTTTGQSYTTTVSYTSSYSSAEWIEEDPSYLDGSLVPFNSFDHVVFSSGNTTMNGSLVSIAGSQAAPITLVDNANKPIVTPSVLINSGTGFWATHD